jgi:hypothetical protein
MGLTLEELEALCRENYARYRKGLQLAAFQAEPIDDGFCVWLGDYLVRKVGDRVVGIQKTGKAVLKFNSAIEAVERLW